MQKFSFGKQKSLKARALFLAEHIDSRTIESTGRIASSPLALKLGPNGCVMLFKFGVVVFFNVDPIAEMNCLNDLRGMLKDPFAQPKTEEIEIRLNPEGEEGAHGDYIYLKSFAFEKMRLIGEALAKSVVLDYYEASVANTFDAIEPIATGLREKGRSHTDAKEILKHIGASLLSLHKLTGRVEICEKPDVLWDHPELERLYARLDDEYELRERHLAVEQKLDLISRTAETVLNLLQTKHSNRLEWYIIILIIMEIFLSLYDMFLHPMIFPHLK